MFRRFEELMNEKHLNMRKVSQATGIPYSTFTDWKVGRYTPKIDKLKKIADFFEVSVDYLITGNEIGINTQSVTERVKKEPSYYNNIEAFVIKNFPFADDEKFMDYAIRLWRLPKSYQKAIFEQIEFQEDKYRKEKEASSMSVNKVG